MLFVCFLCLAAAAVFQLDYVTDCIVFTVSVSNIFIWPATMLHSQQTRHIYVSLG